MDVFQLRVWSIAFLDLLWRPVFIRACGLALLACLQRIGEWIERAEEFLGHASSRSCQRLLFADILEYAYDQLPLLLTLLLDKFVLDVPFLEHLHRIEHWVFQLANDACPVAYS